MSQGRAAPRRAPRGVGAPLRLSLASRECLASWRPPIPAWPCRHRDTPPRSPGPSPPARAPGLGSVCTDQRSRACAAFAGFPGRRLPSHFILGDANLTRGRAYPPGSLLRSPVPLGAGRASPRDGDAVCADCRLLSLNRGVRPQPWPVSLGPATRRARAPNAARGPRGPPFSPLSGSSSAAVGTESPCAQLCSELPGASRPSGRSRAGTASPRLLTERRRLSPPYHGERVPSVGARPQGERTGSDVGRKRSRRVTGRGPCRLRRSRGGPGRSCGAWGALPRVRPCSGGCSAVFLGFLLNFQALCRRAHVTCPRPLR